MEIRTLLHIKIKIAHFNFKAKHFHFLSHVGDFYVKGNDHSKVQLKKSVRFAIEQKAVFESQQVISSFFSITEIALSGEIK